jgi:N-acetylmuramoyl-L-alanine amidase
VAMAPKKAGLIRVFAQNKDLALRSRILRGVYEENLFVLNKMRPRLRHERRSQPRGRILVPALVCILSFLIHAPDSGTLLSSRIFVESMGSPIAQSTAMGSSRGSMNTAELKKLEYNSSLPLSHMLGLGIKRVVIDAGHGGTDLGTSGKMGTLEKNITLDIAKKLKARLHANGFRRVYMTRMDDSLMTLQDRVEFAKDVKADLFISIHVNWLPNTPANVIETYYFGPSRDPKTLELADLENKGSEYGLSDFKEILEKLGNTMKLQESRKLAKSIQKSLFKGSKEKNPHIRNNGVKRAPFAVLVGPEIPAVLAEVSCLSNDKEEQALNSEKHRLDIAEYLAAGLISYLNMGGSENDSKQ